VTKARKLDGQAVAAAMREEIKPDVRAFVAAHGRPPGLGIVLVGSDPASQVYVRNKLKAAEEVGFYADCTYLPETASLKDVLAEVDRLNRSPKHDGILVQSPLPKAMGAGATQRVFDAIAVTKDVDGFAAESVGIDRDQHQVALAGEMLCRRLIELFGSREMNIAVGEVDRRPGKAAIALQRRHLRPGQDLVCGGRCHIACPKCRCAAPMPCRCAQVQDGDIMAMGQCVDVRTGLPAACHSAATVRTSSLRESASALRSYSIARSRCMFAAQWFLAARARWRSSFARRS